MKISDSHGDILEKFVDEKETRDTYEVVWNSGAIPQEFYSCLMEARDFFRREDLDG